MDGIPVVREPNKYAGVVGFLQNLLGGIQQQQQQKQMLKFINEIKSGGAITSLPTSPEAQQFALQLADPLRQAQTAYYGAKAQEALQPAVIKPITEKVGDELYQWSPQAQKFETTGIKAPEKPATLESLRAKQAVAVKAIPGTPEFEKIAGKAEALTAKDKLGMATELRKEFNASKIVTNFQEIERAERGMKQAYETSIDPKTTSKVASDQALAVLFQKMLDPSSVVRESEYARTPEGIGLVNRLISQIPKLQKGGMAITDADRKEIYDMGQKLLNEAKISLNTHIDRYTGFANLYGIDPNYVIGSISKTVVRKSEPEMNSATKEAQDYLKSIGF